MVRRECLLRLSLVDANFCALPATMRNGEIEAAEFRNEQRCAGTGSGGNVGNQAVVVRVTLLDDADEPFSSSNVDAAARAVIKHVVGVAYDRNPGDHLA